MEYFRAYARAFTYLYDAHVLLFRSENFIQFISSDSSLSKIDTAQVSHLCQKRKCSPTYLYAFQMEVPKVLLNVWLREKSVCTEEKHPCATKFDAEALALVVFECFF